MSRKIGDPCAHGHMTKCGARLKESALSTSVLELSQRRRNGRGADAGDLKGGGHFVIKWAWISKRGCIGRGMCPHPREARKQRRRKGTNFGRAKWYMETLNLYR